MIRMPLELRNLVSETETRLSAIAILRARSRLTTAELRKLALLNARLLILCPPERYAWIDGLPVVDILKTLNQQEMEVQK